jgi:hypothetical protein
MTEKEQRAREAEIDVRLQESKVKQARAALEHGYKKLQAEMEKEYDELKRELEREELRLERERTKLELAQAELARGFEV